MQSLLITGGNLEKREEKALQITNFPPKLDPSLQDKLLQPKAGPLLAEITNIDILTIEGKNSIGIEQIRELKQWVSRKPYLGKFKAALILKAEKLTHEAQNALLKTLEEPPKNTLIILTAPQEGFLLPTIASRCKIIKLKKESEIDFPKKQIAQLLNYLITLLNSGVGARIEKAEKIAKTKDETIIFLNQLIFFFREILLKKYQVSPIPTIVSIGDISEFEDLNGKEIVKILRQALRTKEMVEKNANFRLALENFFLDLPLLK